MITMTPVQSKMLQAHGYDASTQTLAVRFGPNKVYHYQGVPQDVAEKLKAAESVGSAFGQLIRGQYSHEIVLDEPEAEAEAAL